MAAGRGRSRSRSGISSGKALGQPLWKLLGGRSERLLAYASSGELVAPEERAERCVALVEAGVRAVKIRFHHGDWRTDVDVVRAVREAVGDRLEIMVDANQGWRMPGDREPRWDVATAAQCARQLEDLGVYWLEEPLRTEDAEGYASLRRRTSVRLAAGELVRQQHEARDLVVRGQIDVIQADVLFVGGIGGCRRIAALADLHGRAWSPHTWSNGLGFLANLHAAIAFSPVPFVEVPYDLPAWAPERRDWLLPEPIEIAVRRDHRASTGAWPRSGDRSRGPRAMENLVRINAAVLRHPGEPIAIEPVELDPPKAREVLVKVAAAGVCHSDVRHADGELGDGLWPAVMGHEGAGVVEAVGEGVTHVAPGDHVAFCFVPACRACRFCLAGKPNLCVVVGEHGARGHVDGWNEPAAPPGRDGAPARPADGLLRRVRRRRGGRRGSRSPASFRSGRRRSSAVAW